MQFLKRIFDFYINSSIHVALSVLSFVRITQFIFKIPQDNSVVYFAFFGTIVGYNFVKYDALARTQKIQMRPELKAIAFLSFISLIATGYFFFQFQRITQVVAIVFQILTLLYTVPFFPNRKNARNWAGIKIYIVSLCWVGVTLVVPIVNSGLDFTAAVFMVAIQRFIIVFVLILIFEIIDLQTDDPNLQTVPQQIGIKKTKAVGAFLLIIFLLLEFLDTDFNFSVFLLKLGIALTTLLFLLFANENKSKYYTSFWAEGIPVLWWLLLMLFQ